MPEPGSEVAFAAEISTNRKHCAISAAWRRENGHVVAELVWYDHPAMAVDRLDGLYMKHDPVAVALDPKSQSATLIKPLADRGVIVLKLMPEDVAVAHGEFLDLVNNGELDHLDQEPLTAAVRAALQRPLSGALALQRQVPVDQSPLTSSEFAVWAFRRWEELSRPGAYVI